MNRFRLDFRALRSLALVVALALVWSACDSADDDAEDVSFVGTWNVTRLAINGADLTEQVFGMAMIESLSAAFEADGAMEIFVVSDGEQLSTVGTYTVTDDTIVLNAESFEAPISLSYDARNTNTVVLTSDDVAILTELSGVDASELPFEVDRIDITISRV